MQLTLSLGWNVHVLLQGPGNVVSVREIKVAGNVHILCKGGRGGVGGTSEVSCLLASSDPALPRPSLRGTS